MIFEMENCGACCTCEIMCCFHHTGKFGSSPTSLRVRENPGGKGHIVVLAESDGCGFVLCDACEGLETPLCMEVCKESDELMKFIKAVTKRRTEMQKAAE